MHFTELPDDIFMDIFMFLDEEWHPIRNATLAALRLTCRRLLPLASEPFYSTLRLKIERKDLSDRHAQAETAGHHVRDLHLDLCMDMGRPDCEPLHELERKDILLASLVNRLPNVRSLTVQTFSVSTIGLPQLVQSMRTLKYVRHLQIIELSPATNGDILGPIRCPVSDGIVYEVVKSSGDHFLSLVFDGQSSLRLETFDAIRSIPTNLETLLLGKCIGVDCRDALCEEVPWACRNSLQHLGFYDCRGAHAGAITCGIASGLWSTCLRTVEVCKSGDHSDARRLPYPIHPRTQPLVLESAHFEHAYEWEIALLAKLRIQELKLTYLPRIEMLRIACDAAAFPGIKKLILGAKFPEADFDDDLIQAACVDRRLDFSLNGTHFLGCTCPYGTN